ncbi:hypothetical protein M409DRAFT_19287 [Zasmidium cellare ATCC 36951]|uniref:Transglycosylase SLT domain-containing protein n=1 Tax=Zasmidium cellare ATCC 36951 TaxID=1080233 RepID=A0A6A6CYK2_ZASCE|nr:uncharacterized protein M409DRAFT_19287 [Zasmidium cellare ATCC 36951]KAF2170466.1 hypothetical protein M409DRAFT_19287 [Zasmidium cellare ATCC 36951]
MRYTDERDEHPTERLPRKPQPSVTASSSRESRRSSRHYTTDDSRKPRTDRVPLGERPAERPRSTSRDRRRRERRAARYAADPEGELLRQERRHERREEREQRRAERKEKRAEIEERRAERDERRRRKEAAAEQIVVPVADRPSKKRDPTEEVERATEFYNQDSRPRDTVYQESTESGTVNNQSTETATAITPNTQDYDLEDGYGHKRQQSKRYYSGPPARAQSWQSYSSDYYEDEKYPYSPSDNAYDEIQWYKRRSSHDRYPYEDSRSCCACRRRWCILGSIAATLIGLIIIIVVAVVVSRNQFSYTPSTAQVNNTAAFASGGATQSSVNDTRDGIGAGTDAYKYYQGTASNFPNHTLWISFEDMWNNNVNNIQQSCGWLKYGADDSDKEIQDIYNAIQDRANASLVDHRLILALVLQESHGCVRVPHTTSYGGVKNTGLMQAHDGHEYNSRHMDKSIRYMVQDGTQGTKKGDGLVQVLNMYGNPYSAARAYNSGLIPKSGDLSESGGATACYVSDVANRLTGWVNAKSTCPGSS